MSVFEWKKEYEIGHLMLDKEHQQLFKIAREAFEVVKPSQKKHKITEVIKKLTDYLNIHIKHEEDYMLSIGYPLLDIQHKMHKKVDEDFDEWKKSFAKKPISAIEKELAHNIEKFIIHHIKYEDVKMRQWCEEHNIDLKGVAWKDSYSLGNELIDNEHRHLFKIANEAFTYAPVYKRKEKIKHTIHELYGYMKEHFIHEEDLMKSIDYPYIQEHIKMHNSIEEGMSQFIKNIPTISLEKIEEQLALFIEEWVVLHVINEDCKIAQWKKNSIKIYNSDQSTESNGESVIDISEAEADDVKDTPTNHPKQTP